MEKQFTDFTLEDDAQTYRLCFDFNELVDAEDATGFNLFQALRSPGSMNGGQMRALLFALLKTGHPDVLLKEAGTLLSTDAETVMNAVWEALGIQSGDAALFLALSKITAERPGVLAEMLQRLTIPVVEPETTPETAPATK